MSISSICLLCFIFWTSAIICSTSSLVTFHVIETCVYFCHVKHWPQILSAPSHPNYSWHVSAHWRSLGHLESCNVSRFLRSLRSFVRIPGLLSRSKTEKASCNSSRFTVAPWMICTCSIERKDPSNSKVQRSCDFLHPSISIDSIILFRTPQRNPCREALLPWASRTWTWPLCLSALTQILMHWFLRMPRILVIWATNSGNSICPLPSFQTKLVVHMFADLHLFTLSLSPSLLLDTSDVIVFCSPKHQKAIYNS